MPTPSQKQQQTEQPRVYKIYVLFCVNDLFTNICLIENIDTVCVFSLLLIFYLFFPHTDLFLILLVILCVFGWEKADG